MLLQVCYHWVNHSRLLRRWDKHENNEMELRRDAKIVCELAPPLCDEFMHDIIENSIVK